MSKQTVLEKCTALMNDEEFDQKKDLILENIDKQMDRFERLVFTYSFEGRSMYLWSVVAEEGQKPSEKRREHFENNKTAYINRYLEMLCDLYDFERGQK